jgi:hypothetical protein
MVWRGAKARGILRQIVISAERNLKWLDNGLNDDGSNGWLWVHYNVQDVREDGTESKRK